MTSNPPLFSLQHTVKNYECDLHHRWKPAAFFQHLTEIAGIHAATLGFGYESMQSSSRFWVLSRLKIQFHGFPTTGDQITIHTWPKTIQQKLFYIRDFEIRSASGQLLAAATSAWLVVDAATRRLLPPQVSNLSLPSNPNRHGLEEPLEKIGLSQTGREQMRQQAGYSDLDILGHVNNSRYVEWICDAIPLDLFEHQQLVWMQVNYDREVQPGGLVSLLVENPAAQPGRWTVEGINCADNSRAFEAVLQWQPKPPSME